jgi:thioesterase domain-containing protein/acyl carrier protein
MSTLSSEQDILIPARAGGTGRSAGEIRAWVVAEISRALDVVPTAVDTAAPLDSLGVGSLAAITMTGSLAKWLKRDLPFTLLWDYASIDGLAQGLADPEAVRKWPRVVNLQPHGNRRPLFCFPGIGGHPVTFSQLAAHLPDDQPCFGLVAPGVGKDETPLTRMEDIAKVMVDTLRPVQPKGPYQLAGYSFGGLLAYEVAQQLSASGETVSTLSVYDQPTLAGRVLRPAWQRLGVHVYLLANSSDRLAYLRERFASVNRALKSTIDKRLFDNTCAADASDAIAKRVTSAHLQAAHRYQPHPYPGSILYFRSIERPIDEPFHKVDVTGGWGALALRGVQVIDLPGNHLNILSAENAPAAARALVPHLWNRD